MPLDHPWWDGLSAAEVDATETAVSVLCDHSWAQALLAHAQSRHSLPAQLRERRGSTAENASDLFELRFAAELAGAGRSADYEFAAGIGNSTVDFRVSGEPHWLIELVSLRTTQAVKASTVERDSGGGVATYSHLVSSDSPDSRNTEEYEMITAIRKILEKAASDGRPTKFPVPCGSYHIVLVDGRGYLGCSGGDYIDYIQMTAGAGALQGDDRMLAKALPGTCQPIRGLFEPRNPIPGALHFRERIHFVGFVAEQRFEAGEIPREILLVNNMNLFSDRDQLWRAVEAFPLPGGRLVPVLLPGDETRQ